MTDPFNAIDALDLDLVSGGTRTATSPSETSQADSLHKIQDELGAMSGGGDQMQMMLMIMQMLTRGHGDQVTSVHSPGLLGSIWGGTTTLK